MHAAASGQHAFTVDADFPGGNLIVQRLDGDAVYVRQDLRDTKGDWFYWCFRVRGAAGRKLRFHFTGSNVLGVRGPAASIDGGATWAWLGRRTVRDKSFSFAFPEKAADVRFAFAPPYVEANLSAFLQRHARNTHLKVDTLCTSGKGRTVELLRLGKLDGQPDHRILLTSRHHACEMMASYALEGILAAVLASDADGQWFRRHCEFLVVPFADKDGVEDGDQGKNRKPRDHNRDYAGTSIHLEVAAIRKLVPAWARGRLRFALDLHCPYIRGSHNEVVYFVGGPSQAIWGRVKQFSRILEAGRTGSLPFHARNNLPFGKSWNTGKNYAQGKSCSRWTAEQPGIWLASSIEIPYANASGQPVTPASARALGRDLARALRLFLEEPKSGSHAEAAEPAEEWQEAENGAPARTVRAAVRRSEHFPSR